MTANKPTSPRLAQLAAAKSNQDGALTAFWQEIEMDGAPLIEPDAADADFSLVTFLWRAASDTVSVSVHLTVDGTGQDEHALAPLPGTNLWHKTFRLRNDYRGAYKFAVATAATPEQTIEYPDPHNTSTFVEPLDPERADHDADDVDSVVELPAAPPRPLIAPQPAVARGAVLQTRFHSKILGNERRVWVYTPPNEPVPDAPRGLLVVLDGRFFTHAIRAPTILDNLLADRQIPSLVAVLVDNPGSTWQAAMATREKELACHAPFSRFLVDELLPWVRQQTAITPDPASTVIAGGSFGGLAAAFAAIEHPAAFGGFLSLSGSFWWKPPADGEWEWLARHAAAAPDLPVRAYLEVGLLESWPTQTGFPGQLLSNRHLRTVLQARGVDVHYAEHMHGHDAVVWPGTLAEGLIALFGRDEPV